MPTFDRSTVRAMLESIDQGNNFPMLRAGYFGGHRKSPFPATDGFVVLKSTLETQKQGDLKWYLLETLRGSAAFHAPNIPLEDGFDAYGLLFDSAHLATTTKAQSVLRTSVHDFVSSIDTSLKRKGYQGDSRVADLLPPSLEEGLYEISLTYHNEYGENCFKGTRITEGAWVSIIDEPVKNVAGSISEERALQIAKKAFAGKADLKIAIRGTAKQFIVTFGGPPKPAPAGIIRTGGDFAAQVYINRLTGVVEKIIGS